MARDQLAYLFLPKAWGFGYAAEACEAAPPVLVPPLATFALVGGDTWRMMDHQVVAVILLRQGEMLLCHRSPARLANPDVWDFAGGHVEPGEDPLDALRREVAEELGVELEGVDGGPVLRRVDPERSLDLTVWVSRRWRGEVSNLQPHEHDAIGWFTAAQAEGLKLADPSYLNVLRRLVSLRRIDDPEPNA